MNFRKSGNNDFLLGLRFWLLDLESLQLLGWQDKKHSSGVTNFHQFTELAKAWKEESKSSHVFCVVVT